MSSEVIAIVERRRRWPPEEKLKILDEVLRPGASVAAISDRHGVSRALVYQWLRHVREGRMLGLSIKPEAATPFAPVRVEVAAPEPPIAPASPPAIARPVPPRRRATTVEITLGNGRTIKVDEDIDPTALAHIVAAVDGSTA